MERWLSSDPIGERGGLNLYGFIRTTPIALIDYLGLIAAGDVISTEFRDIKSLCQPNS